MSDRNLRPTSMALGSLTSTCQGTADASQIVQGQLAAVIVIAVGVFGASMFPLSSTARLKMFTAPRTPGRQVKLQLSSPTARCHVVPPLTETSTAPTTPPLSAAVPVIVTDDSAAKLAPFEGLVMVDVGGITSVLEVAGNMPGCSVPGCAPMSPSKLIVACCIVVSGVVLPVSGTVS